jgi:hypothetical protein
MAVFVNKHGIPKYLAGNKITDVLQSIARVSTQTCLKMRLNVTPPTWVESGHVFYWMKLA